MMGKITIDLEGADSAHFDRISQPESRAFDFPDGVRRIITLPHRYWQAYDIIDDAWGFCGDYEQSSYEWTAEKLPSGHPDFEDKIRDLFAECIRMGWVVYNETVRGNANENR